MSFILYSFISLCDVTKSVEAIKVMLTVLADDIPISVNSMVWGYSPLLS